MLPLRNERYILTRFVSMLQTLLTEFQFPEVMPWSWITQIRVRCHSLFFDKHSDLQRAVKKVSWGHFIGLPLFWKFTPEGFSQRNAHGDHNQHKGKGGCNGSRLQCFQASG